RFSPRFPANDDDDTSDQATTIISYQDRNPPNSSVWFPMAGIMLESDGVLLNETTDKGEFVFLSVENNRSEETTIELPEYIAVTSLVLCSVVLGVGVLGNLLVIIVILTNKLLRSSTNLFLLNLSVADLLVLVTCTPTSLVEIITKRDAWIMGREPSYLDLFGFDQHSSTTNEAIGSLSLEA
ncbi:hypothetical protein TCAL_11696, partial [Tigriopus californicus]